MTISPELWPDKWYEQQKETLSDTLQELLTDGDIDQARKCIIDAIASWEDYHREELGKWERFRKALGL